jgi:hypothetical protein
MQEVVLDARSRRKLSVHVLGSESARAAAAAAEANGGAAEAAGAKATNGVHENGVADSEGKEDVPMEVIKDSWAFKRAQEVYPSPK